MGFFGQIATRTLRGAAASLFLWYLASQSRRRRFKLLWKGFLDVGNDAMVGLVCGRHWCAEVDLLRDLVIVHYG